MKNEGIFTKQIYSVLFAILFVSLAAFIIVSTLKFDRGYVGEITDYSSGWADENGRFCEIREGVAANYGQMVSTSKNSCPSHGA